MPRRSIVIKKRAHLCDEKKVGECVAETAQEVGKFRQSTQTGSRPPGFDRVCEMFGDDDEAWFCLTTPNNALDGAEPLALLHRGKLTLVEAAATGYLQGDFS